MWRKRLPAAAGGKIAKATVLQGLLPISGIWFTVPFRETITIGRERGAGAPVLPERQRIKHPGLLGPWMIRTDVKGFWRIGFGAAPGAIGTGRERGRRRTRQDQISAGLCGPVKLRTQDPHRTKKTCFFCRTGFKERTPQNDDPAV